MNSKRRRHSASFKTKIVLEMLKGSGTVSELASKFEVHPTMITKWRKEFLEKAPGIFSDNSSKQQKCHEQETEELYKKIGQLQMELDWLKKNTGHL